MTRSAELPGWPDGVDLAVMLARYDALEDLYAREAVRAEALRDALGSAP